MNIKRSYLTIAIILIVIFLLIFGLRSCFRTDSARYRTETVQKGDIIVNISATGTLEPEEVIDVGAQVGGLITTFGNDADGKTIDYGSKVEENTVLALIDDSLYKSDVEQADAQLKKAEADLTQLQAKLDLASRDWERAKKLDATDALSQSSYDSYRSSYEAAKAATEVGKAQIVLSKATLDRAQRNLFYCVIRSPVKGVIIDRRVNIGQTVVSSFNAPSLFLIAKDLERMQVWVSVNEADIGSIYPGQVVHFTVDTFPGETFTGKVRKIRLNATMSQNVVTYVVEVTTENKGSKLLPYLTANAQFQIANRKDVLVVPNAALHWSPSESETQKTDPVKGTVWILERSNPKPYEVEVGISDGVRTEVWSSDLKEDMSVITGEIESKKDADQNGTRSPFAPSMPRGSRRM